MTKSRKRWISIISAAILSALSAYLVVLILVVYSSYMGINYAQKYDFTTAQKHAERSQQLINIIYNISPKNTYISKIISATQSVNNTLITASEISIVASTIALESFGGTEIPKETLDDLTENVMDLKNNLANLKELVENKETNKLVTITGQDTDELLSKIERLATYSDEMSDVFLHSSTLLGYDKPARYIVLLQNNMELRPTGGFMGSFALLEVVNGAIKKIEIQDIYEPDGQVIGYVQEPQPISKYLFNGQTPGWRLRDSNWDPDFPTAVQAIDWFFNEGKIKDVDGYIAINLLTITDLISKIEPIYIGDYQIDLTAANFYQHAQKQAEHEFFPGSTQKRDFLGAVASTIVRNISENPSEIAKYLPSIIGKAAKENQLLIYHKNENIAEMLHSLDVDGKLDAVTCSGINCYPDYIHINEANVGVNKANCCINRNIEDKVIITSSGIVRHELTITLENYNLPVPQPPNTWGGGYKNYMRIYTPSESTLISASIDKKSIFDSVEANELEDKKSFGMLVLVPGKEKRQIEVIYELANPINESEIYTLKLQKQSGIDTIPYKLTVSREDSELSIRDELGNKSSQFFTITTDKTFTALQ